MFRPDPYRFEFAIRPASESWFRPAPPGCPELEERRRLLASFPDRHAPWLPAAEPVLGALLDLFGPNRPHGIQGSDAVAARALGERWEPDFVLLRRDAVGEFRMVGGCVCDPSAWDPADKLGRTLPEIHAPVPTLNDTLGPRIRTFLDRLAPDAVVTRENWGLAAVPDRNLHPALNSPRLGPDSDPDGVWLRVEHQAFRAVPGVGGIVFLIWLTVHPLREVLSVPGVSEAFCRSLESMPEAVARYKGLVEARAGLVERIRRAVPGSVPAGSGLGSPHAEL